MLSVLLPAPSTGWRRQHAISYHHGTFSWSCASVGTRGASPFGTIAQTTRRSGRHDGRTGQESRTPSRRRRRTHGASRVGPSGTRWSSSLSTAATATRLGRHTSLGQETTNSERPRTMDYARHESRISKFYRSEEKQVGTSHGKPTCSRATGFVISTGGCQHSSSIGSSWSGSRTRAGDERPVGADGRVHDDSVATTSVFLWFHCR